MNTHTRQVRLGPPSLIQRLWYRALRMPAPAGVEPTRGSDWARLVPWQWWRFHRWYATRHGFYWMPCILCRRPYGGHQAGDSVPDPTGPHGAGVVICPSCTRAGRGWRVPHPLEAVLDALQDEHEHGHDDWVTDCVRCLALDVAIRNACRENKE